MLDFFRNAVSENKLIKDLSKKYLADGIEKQLQLMSFASRGQMAALVELNTPDMDVVHKLLSLEMAFKDAYMLNSTVATCVNFIADSVSSVPFVLKEKDKKGIVKDIKHASVDRLNDPNDYQDGVAMRKVLTQHALLCGNALMWPNSDYAVPEMKAISGPVKSIELFDPDDFDVISYNKRSIDHYEVKKLIWEAYPQRYPKRVFKANELIHFIDNPDPTQPYWGIGRIQSSYRSIDISSKIQTWWIETLRNGCRKDAILKFKKDLGDAQFRRIKSQVNSQLQGLRNGGGVMVIGREHEVDFLNQSPKEMDFSTAEKDSSRKIMSIFRVPAPLLNEAEHSTYNNQAEARKAFWLDNVLMICNGIASVLNKFYLTKFDDLRGRNVWLTYDFSKVDALVRQYLDLVKGAVEMFGMGHSRDDINEYLDMGWHESEGSKDSFINANVIPYKERQARLALDQAGHELNVKTQSRAASLQRQQLKQGAEASASQPPAKKPAVNK